MQTVVANYPAQTAVFVQAPNTQTTKECHLRRERPGWDTCGLMCFPTPGMQFYHIADSTRNKS